MYVCLFWNIIWNASGSWGEVEKKKRRDNKKLKKVTGGARINVSSSVDIIYYLKGCI